MRVSWPSQLNLRGNAYSCPRRAADFKQHLVFVEAENMTTTGGWRALDWAYSDNYYAATISDTFLSRRS